MEITLDNGEKVIVTLVTDYHGLPAMKIDDLYVASLLPDGRLMLSGLVAHDSLQTTDTAETAGVIQTVGEMEWVGERR